MTGDLIMHRASPFLFLPPLAPLACGLSLLLAPAAATHSGDSPVSASDTDATGTTITVTNCNDSGPGSLRDAVASAIGDETIDMRGLSCRRIDLTSGAIVIPQLGLTLLGGGGMTVDANHASRVFQHEGSSWLRIRGMTIARGLYEHHSRAWGGGIYSEGNVALRYSLVHGCIARRVGYGYSTTQGGGIYASQAVRLVDSQVLGNTVTGPNAEGGGIYAGFRLTAIRSHISDNHAPEVGGGASSHGLTADYATISDNTGAVDVSDFYDTVIANSTISGNHTTSWIWGVVNIHAFSGGSATIVNSTISGNTSGTVTLRITGRERSIVNSTIAFNQHSGGTGSFVCPGWATVFLPNFSEAIVHVDSTIIANNSCAGKPHHDIGRYANERDPYVLRGANNLITSSYSLRLPPDTLSADPGLAPLTNNGGPTKTHALLSGSPAINVGSNVADLDYDQRGAGYPRAKRLRADIGAYER